MKLLEYFKHDIERLELVPSHGGKFEVSVQGDLVFSKIGEDRFPTYDEIKPLLVSRIV